MMLMKCVKSGKYIKQNFEAVRDGSSQALWVLIDDIEQASNDPALVCGEDLTMEMTIYMKDTYGCTEGLTCEWKENPAQEEVSKKQIDKLSGEEQDKRVVAVVGRGFPSIDELLELPERNTYPINKFYETPAVEYSIPNEKTFVPHYKQPKGKYKLLKRR